MLRARVSGAGGAQDLGRFEEHRADRLAYLLRGLAAVQGEAAARTANTWRQVAADLERPAPAPPRPASVAAAHR